MAWRGRTHTHSPPRPDLATLAARSAKCVEGVRGEHAPSLPSLNVSETNTRLPATLQSQRRWDAFLAASLVKCGGARAHYIIIYAIPDPQNLSRCVHLHMSENASCQKTLGRTDGLPARPLLSLSRISDPPLGSHRPNPGVGERGRRGGGFRGPPGLCRRHLCILFPMSAARHLSSSSRGLAGAQLGLVASWGSPRGPGRRSVPGSLSKRDRCLLLRRGVARASWRRGGSHLEPLQSDCALSAVVPLVPFL